MASRPAGDDEIPVLDLGDYMAGADGALARLSAQMHDACTRIGFFYITNHGVPQDLIDRTFAEAARFHAQPLEDKLKLRIDAENIGYLPMASSTITSTTVATTKTPSQNEAFFVKNELSPDHPDVVARKPFKGLNQWPDGLPGFRETVLEYVDAQMSLGLKLLPLYAVSLGLPATYFNDHPAFREPGIRVRMSHYPPQPDRPADVFGHAPHTDYGWLTILPQSDIPGLEILTPAGEWLRAPKMPGHFLINTGDMCMRISNDRFVSTPHRAVNESTGERYAIPFFFNPDAEVEMAVVEACCGPDNPPRYEPITYGDYFRSRISKNYDHHKTAAAE